MRAEDRTIPLWRGFPDCQGPLRAWRFEPVDRFPESSFQFVVGGSREARTGNQEQVGFRREEVLVVSENFAQKTFCPIAVNGVADPAGSDDAKTPGCALCGTSEKIKTKKSALRSFTGSANSLEIDGRAHVLLARKPHGGGLALQALSRLRPRARRARRTLRPECVALRARNPNLRARFKREGR